MIAEESGLENPPVIYPNIAVNGMPLHDAKIGVPRLANCVGKAGASAPVSPWFAPCWAKILAELTIQN